MHLDVLRYSLKLGKSKILTEIAAGIKAISKFPLYSEIRNVPAVYSTVLCGRNRISERKSAI